MLYRGIVSPENDDTDSWHFHMTMIVLLRYVMAQFFISLSRIHAITEKTRIQSKGIDFKQVDREDHWDDYILLQYIVMSMVHFCPGLGFKNFPVFEKKGMTACCYTSDRRSTCNSNSCHMPFFSNTGEILKPKP